MENKNNQPYRHGDVVLIPVARLPKGLKTHSKGKLNKLALGEVTGHSHKLTTDFELEVFEDSEGVKYFNLPKEATITHEEHKTGTLAPATYKVIIKKEFDYFANEMRKVLD